MRLNMTLKFSFSTSRASFLCLRNQKQFETSFRTYFHIRLLQLQSEEKAQLQIIDAALKNVWTKVSSPTLPLPLFKNSQQNQNHYCRIESIGEVSITQVNLDLGKNGSNQTKEKRKLEEWHFAPENRQSFIFSV